VRKSRRQDDRVNVRVHARTLALMLADARTHMQAHAYNHGHVHSCVCACTRVGLRVLACARMRTVVRASARVLGRTGEAPWRFRPSVVWRLP
jgi:hypothetical protein